MFIIVIEMQVYEAFDPFDPLHFGFLDPGSRGKL